MKARKMPVVYGMNGNVRATGVPTADRGNRATVGGLVLLPLVLALVVLAAVANFGRLEEELRRSASHKDLHRLAPAGR
jgi:hypothetical protein